MGGALGLIACCDMAIASPDTRFGFTEVRLGLVPAVISPFVIRKIGLSAARRYFVSGEVFDATAAAHMGLVHQVAALDEAVEAAIDTALKAGPQAVREAKLLLRQTPLDMEQAVQTIARLRTSPEGQEGLAAFLEKRKPNWQ